MRLTLRALLLTLPLWTGLGCSLFNKSKPKPALPGQTIKLPGTDMSKTTPPSAVRTQKPEQPPVIALPPATAADGKVEVKVVAYVNNMPIFDSEVREGLMMRLRELEGLSESQREAKLKEFRAAELEKLIEREVVLDTAYKHLKKLPPKLIDDLQREAGKEFEHRIKELKEAYKVKTDDQLKALMEQQGTSMANLRRSMERSFISMEYMRNLIFPKLHLALSEIRAYYEQHPEQFTDKDKAKWLDIFIDAGKFPTRDSARDYAAQVAANLRGGGDFSATAKQLQEAGYNALLGPDGIGETPGEIRPAELEAAVFSLDAAQVSNPVEVAGGFHVVKVTDRHRAGRRPFDADTQNEIRNKLLNALAGKEYKRLVEQMKETALIQRLE